MIEMSNSEYGKLFDELYARFEAGEITAEEVCAGIMSWDLATDIDVTNNKSLLKAIKEEFEYYANPTE